MSLYDDLVENEGDHDRPNWSGIKLLENHLRSRKKSNQSKAKDSFGRRPMMSAGLGFKPSVSNEQALSAMEAESQEKRSMGSLLGGDWDITKEYDPLFPNDYEKVAKERREEKISEDDNDVKTQRRKERNEKAYENTSGISLVARSLVDAYSDDEDETENKFFSRPPRHGGAAIAPPPSLIEKSEPEITNPLSKNLGKGSVAAKIMARMGYKEGQGLGKDEQGISRALEVEKTSFRGGKIVTTQENEFTTPKHTNPNPPVPVINEPQNTSEQSITEIMKNPTKVVLLRNMVGPGEVDNELEPEVKEECSKYGEVVKCIIYELTGGIAEEAVRIFVEFKRVESAIKAVVDLNGRYFGGRVVKGNFYDVEKFKKLELND